MITRTITLHCDHLDSQGEADCDEKVSVEALLTATGLRKIALDHRGWTRTAARDLCRRHDPKLLVNQVAVS